MRRVSKVRIEGVYKASGDLKDYIARNWRLVNVKGSKQKFKRVLKHSIWTANELVYKFLNKQVGQSIKTYRTFSAAAVELTFIWLAILVSVFNDFAISIITNYARSRLVSITSQWWRITITLLCGLGHWSYIKRTILGKFSTGRRRTRASNFEVKQIRLIWNIALVFVLEEMKLSKIDNNYIPDYKYLSLW